MGFGILLSRYDFDLFVGEAIVFITVASVHVIGAKHLSLMVCLN